MIPRLPAPHASGGTAKAQALAAMIAAGGSRSAGSMVGPSLVRRHSMRFGIAQYGAETRAVGAGAEVALLQQDHARRRVLC